MKRAAKDGTKKAKKGRDTLGKMKEPWKFQGDGVGDDEDQVHLAGEVSSPALNGSSTGHRARASSVPSFPLDQPLAACVMSSADL